MLTFKSTKLAANLERLRSQYAGAKVSALISVPDDMSWWFYQEWGTATHFAEDSVEIPSSVTVADIPGTTKPGGYVISTDKPGGIRLPGIGGGKEKWVPHVGPPFTQLHPGVRPKAFVRRILQQIHQMSTVTLAQELVEGGYEIAAVRESLFHIVMPDILNAITDSMAEQLNSESDRDLPGKLGNTSPANAFGAAARIVDTGNG